MSSNGTPGAKFAVGQAVKLNTNVQVEGYKFGDSTQERLIMTHESSHVLTVEKSGSNMPICKTTPTDIDVPVSAKHWAYRLRATLSDTYTVYQADEMIDKAKGRVRHTHVTKTQGTTIIESNLIEPGKVVFLLKPFKYQMGSKTITLNAGTPVGIVGKATTSTGGLAGEVGPQNAYYAIQTVIPKDYHYIWKSDFLVHESQLTAA